MKCALVHSITSPNNFETITILGVLDAIKTEKYKAKIDALPRAKTDKKAYTEAKRHLASWALNGEFSGKVSNENFTESNGLFHFDIDNLENPTAIKYQLAREIPEVYALWLSPSGQGLKGLLRIPDDLIHDDTDFKKAFEQIQTYLAVYDIEIDKACKDVRRLCFVSSDSDIYINDTAPAFMFDSVKWDYNPTVKPAAPSTQAVNSNNADRYITRCCDIILNAGAGNYHNARLRAGKLAGGFIAAGMVNEHEIMQALSDASDAISAQSGDSEQVIQREQKTIYDAMQHGKAQPVELEYRQQNGQQMSNVLYRDFEKNELDTITPATPKQIEENDFDYEPEPRPTFENPTAPLPIKHLAAICDYINAPIYYYSPKATQHAALSVICHIVSRRFLSDGGDKCSLMIGNVGATVSQLADINNSIEALFCDLGQDDDVRLDRMSYIDLTTHFTNEGSSGKLLYLPADLGAMIRASQKQTSLAMDGFLSELMQFHDKERHTFRTSKARAKVEIPVINSYANFDDKDLFTFGRASNNDGLFNLFLTQLNDSKDFIFNEKKHRPLTNTDSFTQLKEHINQLTDKSNGLLPAVKTPNAGAATVIPWAINPNAYAEKLKTAAGGGKTCGRVMKQFVNLTTAIAAWNGDNAVTEQLAGVCCDYVCYRVSEMFEALKKREKDDIAPDVMSRVLSVIHRAGADGISESRLIQSCAGFRRLTTEEREAIILALHKNKEITDTLSDGVNKGNGGRKGRKFFIR